MDHGGRKPSRSGRSAPSTREWTPERPTYHREGSSSQYGARSSGEAAAAAGSSWHSPTTDLSFKQEPPSHGTESAEMQIPLQLKPEYYYSTVKPEPTDYLQLAAASALAAIPFGVDTNGAGSSGPLRVRSFDKSPNSRRRRTSRSDSRSKSRSPRRKRSKERRRRSSRSRSRSRHGKRSRSRSRPRHRRSNRSRSRSRSRSHGRKRERSRSKDRRHRKHRGPNMTTEMLKIRREVELMYDNAMQSMIKKKEEEFAQLQALVMPSIANPGYSTAPVSPPRNPLEGATNYAPALPVQGLSAGWGAADPRAAAGRSGPGFGLANRLRYDLTIPPPGSVAAAAAAAGMLGCGLPAPVAAFSSLSAPPETEYNFLMDIKNRFFPVVDIKALPEHLPNLVTNIEGSRFIQENLDRATVQDKEALFRKILPKTVWLAMNVFGNYVIQKYFECGTGQQVMQMFHKVMPETRKLTMNKYGSRVVQTAFSYVTPEQHTEWTKEIVKDVIAFCKDANGNHVVQKCMETAESTTSPHMEAMLSRIQEVAFNLCGDRFGCRVLQKAIQVYSLEQTVLIRNVAHELTHQLMTSPFGNYLIQDLMEHGTPEDRNRVFAACVGKVLQMSHDKFASNILENVLKKGSMPEKNAIVKEVCNPEALLTMMKDQYGNYVVQRMMDTTDAAMLRELHVIMLVFIRDITPTINEKMHKNVDLNVQKPDVMHLAGVYFAQPDKFAELRCKHGANLPKIEEWLRQIKCNEHLSIENADVSLLVSVMADIAGLAEHTDLNSLVYDLRSYLKCLVQDYCKKNASFAARPPQPPHLKMEPIMAAAPPPAVGFPYGTVVPAHHYGPGASSSIFVNMQEAKPVPHELDCGIPGIDI